MGGKLELQSVEGEGSEFYFSIKTELKGGDKTVKSSINNIARCLVIDDNKNNRRILKRIITQWGIECVTCTNGYESLKILEETKPFDVILCDYHMPYLDGFETVKMVREKLNISPEKLPIIMLHSSADEAEQHDKSKELGIHFGLIKPIKQSELKKSLIDTQKPTNGKEGAEIESLNTVKTMKEMKIYPSHRILVAEDNHTNMVLITTLLKRFVPHAEIIEAANGKDALDKMITYKPDLVFMDVQMPEMDGNEATVNLRKYETDEDVTRTIIVGLTAGALKQEKEKSMQSGMDDFLTKPIDTGKLREILATYLQKRNVQKEVNSGNNGTEAVT